MLRVLREGQRWLTGLFVIGIGGVFVFFLGLGGPLTGSRAGTVVEVGPHSYGFREFERVRGRREEAVREQLGEQYDARALSDTLDNLAARELVDQALLAMSAEELGLAVSKREIERGVLRDPGFRDEAGRFDKERFDSFAQYEYGSQHNFLRDRRTALLSYKMLRLLNDQPQVSDGEVREAVRRQLQEVRIAFVALDATAAPEDTEIDPEEVARALEARASEIEQRYEDAGSRYDAPEQVRARHVLISVPRGAEEAAVEAARATAQEARERIEAGEDFAAVAAELSEDAGSKTRGGDLGFFARGQMVPEFDAAAFTLEPGEISDLVRSEYGFHVIRVEERREAFHRPLEEVREELAMELLRREAANARAREIADRLAAAVREGRPLEQAAREEGLTLERSGWLKRRPDGFVPGLGAAQDLLAAAFALEPGQSATRVFDVGDKLALVQTLERKEPGEEEIESRLEEARERLLTEKRNTRAEAWINARRTELIDANELRVDLESVRRR
jgi:peptidyl-prolyl cis-trans isomerase D